MAPLPVGLSDYWTIALFDVLYQYFYTQEALHCWTIGLLDYCSIIFAQSIFLLVHYEYLLEYMVHLTVGLSDYWTIAMFNILYQDFYIFPM